MRAQGCDGGKHSLYPNKQCERPGKGYSFSRTITGPRLLHACCTTTPNVPTWVMHVYDNHICSIEQGQLLVMHPIGHEERGGGGGLKASMALQHVMGDTCDCSHAKDVRAVPGCQQVMAEGMIATAHARLTLKPAAPKPAAHMHSAREGYVHQPWRGMHSQWR